MQRRVKVIGDGGILPDLQALIGKEGVIVALVSTARPLDPTLPATPEVETPPEEERVYAVRVDGTIYDLSDRVLEKVE